jgi:hypothetical protein
VRGLLNAKKWGLCLFLKQRTIGVTDLLDKRTIKKENNKF